MKYNWQHPDWPKFTYNNGIYSETLYRYAQEASRLSGGLVNLQQAETYEAYIDLMVSEAINTSRIEGENLNKDDVRSSIKNFMGLSNPPSRVMDPRAEGIAALMVDVRNTFESPLTKEKLCYWHQLVMTGSENSVLQSPINVGHWRASEDPMRIVSGPIGYETVHFEAPPSNRIEEEMLLFLNWYQDTSPYSKAGGLNLPGPLRAAIAHLWFESIHPFDDGNGRIGRAISEHALCQDLKGPVLLSISTSIQKDRNAYYTELNQASKATMDITSWVSWFSQLILQAQKDAVANIEFVLSKTRFWQKHQNTALNSRQVKMIKKLFNAGPDGFEHGLSAQKYMSIARCSKATASRDLTDLVNKDCFYRLPGGGRNTRYTLRY